MQKSGPHSDYDNLPMSYVQAGQNPAYPPQAPPYSSTYMPAAPPYSEQNPSLVGAPGYSAYPPPPDQPHHGFLGEGGPKPDVEMPPEYTAGIEDINPFSERAVRRAFIRKVYITLTIQLVITFGLVFMFTFWQTLRQWTWQNPYLAYALLPSTFILIMVLACCNQARRRVPLNFILLGIFTVFEGCLLGSLAAFFDADAVMWATGATILVTLGLTIFALQTKWDFTILSGGLMVALLVLLSFGILAAIFRSLWLNIVYACIGTFIFGMYLVVDTQLITGGKHRYSISPEEYIFAALNIYVDIINLFMLLLQIFGLCR
ncbi:protein lifeguard 1-like [Bufo gargarizans]|uniref:protein lifeguard 1-like n=1 Tax=Bufo gargarizans TaxID=30331 RepID=UPI001CF33797|nr:protein lifeguard 1-like [Bufo gargarizans]